MKTNKINIRFEKTKMQKADLNTQRQTLLRSTSFNINNILNPNREKGSKTGRNLLTTAEKKNGTVYFH